MKDAFSLPGAAAAALAFLCVGCGGGTPSDSSEAGRLSRSRALWATASVNHYSFTVQRSCFCTPDSNRAVIVEVEKGAVKSLTFADDGTPADPVMFSAFDTVEEQFAQIEQAIRQNSTLTNVTYDPTLGYLTGAGIDWVPGATDDEVSLTITNFTRL
ncbi:MAG: DUF6174 domain-containing protein [Armatimonas sp.]